MFAGPNGSGKSTLKHLIKPELLGVYINADDIELQLKTTGKLSLSQYRVVASSEEWHSFLQHSMLNMRDLEAMRQLVFDAGWIQIQTSTTFTYQATMIAEFIRTKLLDTFDSFSFETVMSHVSKVELLKQAQQRGYRTYLYYVATDDPEINIRRVQVRVSQGGHAVPETKIRSRYSRSLGLLMDAIKVTNRAYLFDNSVDGCESAWLAEVTEGTLLEMKTGSMPVWFQHAVWNKLPTQELTPANPQ